MGELTEQDFSFNGQLGSQGAVIRKIGVNHFNIQLGTAPGHPEWFNLLQFEILRNAKGNELRLDVEFKPEGEASQNILFNHDASTWSYDGRNWMPVSWEQGFKNGAVTSDTLQFPEFTEDRVVFGAQVPMSYENVVEFIEQYRRNPHVTVHLIGKSLGGRNIYRLEITDAKSTVPRSERWAFHVNQQHCGEHHGKWRMIGMIDWLLSEKGADFRKRSVWHFVIEMNPDAATNGWYRVNAQGVDLNRAFLMTGADPEKQAHESYVMQKDFEGLMASDTPISACWSMHTWPDEAQPFMHPGPEIGTVLGPWTELRDILDRLDTNGLIRSLPGADDNHVNTNTWHRGPYEVYGITNFLCEGSDFWTDKDWSLEVGQIFIQAMAEFYNGIRTHR